MLEPMDHLMVVHYWRCGARIYQIVELLQKDGTQTDGFEVFHSLIAQGFLDNLPLKYTDVMVAGQAAGQSGSKEGGQK